LLFKKTVVMAC